MTIPRRARISITFTDYWLGGTGGSGKGDVDVAAYRDDAKCPAMPMTQIKGTLRETARDHGVWSEAALERYFGRQLEEGDERPELQAAIRFAGDAMLATQDQNWFAANDAARSALFSTLRSTALNESGVAKNQSLRSVEVCHPCSIVKEVEWVCPGEPDTNWIADLSLLCQLTFAFGRMKNDGLGRATASCVAIDDLSKGDVQTPTDAIILTLIPEDAASFSRHNATEGLHQSHAAPPGSALWGWAISKLYGDDKAQAYELFHSGKVKFSDAVPLIDRDSPAFPNPVTLLYAKHDGTPISKDGLDTDKLYLNREDFKSGPGKEKKQAESLKGYHISRALNQTAKTGRNHRLRTAISEGKAKDGQLFGTEFVKAPTGYRATIEGSDDHLKIIAEAFPDGGRIFLGRARNSGYGGAYTCKWEGQNPWPAGETVKGNEAALWCLSDMALVDDFGMPCIEPAGKDFGLDGWTLDLTKSSINTRRFAPWNRTEGGRSGEICVIEAGSVLCYTRPEGDAGEHALKSIVGLHQERGFGRVTLMPAIGKEVSAPPAQPSAPSRGVSNFQKTVEARAALLDTRKRDAYLKLLLNAVKKVAAKGPTRTQWSKLSRAARRSKNVAELLAEISVGGREELKDPSWAKGGLQKGIARVQNSKIGKNLPYQQLRFAVDQIVKTAKEHAPKGDQGDWS
jgi:hypothetical protein